MPETKTRSMELSVSAQIYRELIWDVTMKTGRLSKMEASEETLKELDELDSILTHALALLGRIAERERV